LHYGQSNQALNRKGRIDTRNLFPKAKSQFFPCKTGGVHRYLLETVDVNAADGIRAAAVSEVELRLGKVDTPLLLCGHSHIPRLLQLPDGRLLVNPGSVGVPAYDDDWGGYHKVQMHSPHARYAVVEHGPHGWSVQLRAVAYDWQQAVARVLANGRPDYALWLTGRA
jgi:diadenosine tetraphosphatase ApaH/serine/threonine PP2A family protein phosphatase